MRDHDWASDAFLDKLYNAMRGAIGAYNVASGATDADDMVRIARTPGGIAIDKESYPAGFLALRRHGADNSLVLVEKYRSAWVDPAINVDRERPLDVKDGVLRAGDPAEIARELLRDFFEKIRKIS